MHVLKRQKVKKSKRISIATGYGAANPSVERKRRDLACHRLTPLAAPLTMPLA
jgi:hypothetical protein